jgi:hypothetical protein
MHVQATAIMKPSIIAVVLLSTPLACFAQELYPADRACIIEAMGKLPPVAAAQAEGSRIVERRVVPQPQSPGRKYKTFPVYRIKVEIDVFVAGHRSTYIFNCVLSGDTALIQPLGMR